MNIHDVYLKYTFDYSDEVFYVSIYERDSQHQDGFSDLCEDLYVKNPDGTFSKI